MSNVAGDAGSQSSVATGSEPMEWVTPLETIASLDIVGSTEIDAFPGDDGLGVFTQS